LGVFGDNGRSSLIGNEKRIWGKAKMILLNPENLRAGKEKKEKDSRQQPGRPIHGEGFHHQLCLCLGRKGLSVNRAVVLWHYRKRKSWLFIEERTKPPSDRLKRNILYN